MGGRTQSITAMATIAIIIFVVLGTALASNASVHHQVERLTQFLGDEGRRLSTRAEHLLREHMEQLALGLGGVPRANAVESRLDQGQSLYGLAGQVQAGPHRPALRPQRNPGPGETAGQGSGYRPEPSPGFQNGGGSSLGSSASTGQGPGNPDNADQRREPDRPVATTLPGAVWILGSGLACLGAAFRFRRTDLPAPPGDDWPNPQDGPNRRP